MAKGLWNLLCGYYKWPWVGGYEIFSKPYSWLKAPKLILAKGPDYPWAQRALGEMATEAPDQVVSFKCLILNHNIIFFVVVNVNVLFS